MKGFLTDRNSNYPYFRGGTVQRFYLWLNHDIEHTSTILLAAVVILFLIVGSYGLPICLEGLLYVGATIFYSMAAFSAVLFIFTSLCMAELICRTRIRLGKTTSLFKNQRGWLYLDALIGMILVSIACVAIMAAYTQSTKATGVASNRATAVSIAEQVLESYKQYDGGTVSPPTSYTSPDPNFSIAITNPSVTALSGTPKVIPVQVTVSWPAVDPQNSVQMISYYYIK
ncbi:MAG: type II secretion system protein [Veillonellales bacterium]